MSGTFTITKRYRIFQGESIGEPMDEMNEDQMRGWLRSRGCSEEEVCDLVERLDSDSLVTFQFSRQEPS